MPLGQPRRFEGGGRGALALVSLGCGAESLSLVGIDPLPCWGFFEFLMNLECWSEWVLSVTSGHCGQAGVTQEETHPLLF